MAAAALLPVLPLPADGAAAAVSGTPAVRQLQGTLRLAPGGCRGGTPRGSFLTVTTGTRAIRNPRSSCAHGAYTVLPGGPGGLSTTRWTAVSADGFDGSGDADDAGIVAPTRFGAHRLSLVTAAQDLQDDPGGAAIFRTPRIYLVGNELEGDLRSLQVLYGGTAGATCSAANGRGCWLLGTQHATGAYDSATHAFTLSWFTGQSFAGPSAGTAVHLAGTFHGSLRPVPAGTVVDLGTDSFAAGVARGSTVSDGSVSGAGGRRGHGHRGAGRRAARLSSSSAGSTRSPLPFLVAYALVVANLVAAAATWRWRRVRRQA